MDTKVIVTACYHSSLNNCYIVELSDGTEETCNVEVRVGSIWVK